jgi:hypothetical protein
MRPGSHLLAVLAFLALPFAACEDSQIPLPPSTFSAVPLPFPAPVPVTLSSSAIVGLGFLPNGTACAVSKNGLFLSSDSGSTWSAAGTIPPGENIQTLAIDGSGTIFLGADSPLERLDPHEIYPLSLDVLRSTDAGKTWQRVSSFSRPIFNEIVLACNQSGDLIAGYHASGFAISKDKGQSWTTVSGYWCSGAAVSDSRALFMASAIGNVRRSDDLGATWSTCPGLAVEGQASFLSMFVTSEADTVFVVESNGPGMLFRSASGGTGWTPVWTGFVTGMCRSPRGVYYFASGDLLFRSIKGGTNWSLAGKPGAEITALAAGGGEIVLVGTTNGTVIRWRGE